MLYQEDEKSLTGSKFDAKDGGVCYVIPGDPIPLLRVRIGRRRCWDPQKQLRLITSITIMSQHGERPKYVGPLRIDMTFFFPIPKTLVKRIKPGMPHTIKPDLDNLVKMICDLCQSTLFTNNCYIIEINCRKIYDSTPRSEFLIYTLENL
jgi:Holliday junction resolvase RusA-like endonuclease